jgi:DNA primase
LQDWFNIEQQGELERYGANALNHSVVHQGVLPAVTGSNAPLGFALSGLDETHPYLKARGLSPETIATFGLGLCAYGSLREWIAIPIHDAQGRLLAYAGRWPGTPPDGWPKYRLPRGFRKSLELFNQHRAAAALKDDPLVVTEGFFGCMHVWQAGYRRVVALMGSVLSEPQEQKIIALSGNTRQVRLLFDEDPAGQQGRRDAAQRLSRSVLASVLELAEGQQPDGLNARELLRLVGTFP